VIVGFCGETEAQFESTLDLLRTVRYDQVFAAAFSVRPGTPAARLPDDVPAHEKRRRLNALLELQEEIGLSINQGWVGRTTEVLVERVESRRSHDHDESQAPGQRVSGRNREHKLVHVDGDASLIGERVDVVIERAGPYALTGRRSA
jgi:tRNA-2-methylthio-N6-dimethylallyladenosine synthase